MGRRDGRDREQRRGNWPREKEGKNWYFRFRQTTKKNQFRAKIYHVITYLQWESKGSLIAERFNRKNSTGKAKFWPKVLRHSLPIEKLCERDKKKQNFTGRQNEVLRFHLSVLAKNLPPKLNHVVLCFNFS